MATVTDYQAEARRLTCLDCPAPYGDDGWCDVVIPDAIWNAICPGGGVLCFRCMTKRLTAAGLRDVPVVITSGPYLDDNEAWRLIGLEHGRKEGQTAARIAELRGRELAWSEAAGRAASIYRSNPTFDDHVNETLRRLAAERERLEKEGA